MVKMTKSKTFQAYLPNCHRTYSCVHCRAHLANHDELISKSFQGSQGRAYLFNSVVNVGCGPAEERVLLTGLHAVADIYCENCKTTLGWKYVSASTALCCSRRSPSPPPPACLSVNTSASTAHGSLALHTAQATTMLNKWMQRCK
uniref:Protein yippee-like n=1 Tax=Lynx canadensis TaxID=61383 RepID=A0A667IGS5_LYNCA